MDDRLRSLHQMLTIWRLCLLLQIIWQLKLKMTRRGNLMGCLGLGSSTDSLPLLSLTQHFSFQDKKKIKKNCVLYLRSIMDI